MSHSNGALSGLSPDELRDAVRAVLREVLPAGTVADSGAPPAEVVIASDADLTVFVRRVAAMCEEPEQRAAMQEGRHGFRLAARGGLEAQALTAFAPQPPILRVERGAVTERVVVKAAAEGERLVLGPRAVLTPLARDKARALGVTIEKEH